jgi:RND family efflux transporter MFP subunit
MTIIFRRFTFWLALAGLTGLVFFVHANTSIAPMPEPPLTPPKKPFEKGIGASGIIESLRENTSIGVPFAALVTEIKVKVWQKVAKGDLLMRLDDREIRIKLIGQRAELSVREAEQHRAQRQYDRLAKIGAGAAVAREDLETKEDDLLVAKANVEKAKAAIAETEGNLERFLIRSPIDATILQINLREGEHATPGGSTIPIVLGSIDNLQIRADVDEQIAPRVKVGARAAAYRKGETDRAIPLTFVRIEPYIIPKKSLTGAGSERVDTRVLPVIFSFANHEELKTYVGQQVDIFIEE